MRFFPHPLRKEFCPLTVSQFLCPVSGQTSCQHRSQLLQVCLPTIIDFGASHGCIVLLAQSRVGCRGSVFSFYTQQNSLVCSKVKFLKWRLGVPSVAASQNKMLEELYGLASEPGVWRGNVDRCHSRQDFGSAGLLLDDIRRSFEESSGYFDFVKCHDFRSCLPCDTQNMSVARWSGIWHHPKLFADVVAWLQMLPEGMRLMITWYLLQYISVMFLSTFQSPFIKTLGSFWRLQGWWRNLTRLQVKWKAQGICWGGAGGALA